MEKIAAFSIALCKSVGVEKNDGLIELADDVLVSIMSRLTTKEAAQLSVLSHEWNKLWARYPGILSFEDSMTVYEQRRLYLQMRCPKRDALVRQDTCNFVRWVTRVVEQHVGPSLEQFKVAFDLDNTYQSDIDKWVVFVLFKGVSTLELKFNANEIVGIEQRNFYSMPLKCCIAPRNLPSRLKTLVLSHMEITAQVLECFLQSCVLLENLRMRKISSLGSIRASHSLLALKHFDVSDSQLKIIDILAPKLLTFRYHGCNIELNIQSALSLSEVSIGVDDQHPIHAMKSLSEYFAQLEYLHMTSYMLSRKKMVLPGVPNLTNVKHLKLTIESYSSESLLEWITLIDASPVLQKFTLEFTDHIRLDGEVALKKRCCPRRLKCLTTLEVYGFMGLDIELELVTYVIENGVALEEIFIDLKRCLISEARLNEERAKAEFKDKLPPGAKLVINNRFQLHNFMHAHPSINVYKLPPQGMWRRIYKTTSYD